MSYAKIRRLENIFLDAIKNNSSIPDSLSMSDLLCAFRCITKMKPELMKDPILEWNELKEYEFASKAFSPIITKRGMEIMEHSENCKTIRQIIYATDKTSQYPTTSEEWKSSLELLTHYVANTPLPSMTSEKQKEIIISSIIHYLDDVRVYYDTSLNIGLESIVNFAKQNPKYEFLLNEFEDSAPAIYYDSSPSL